VHPNRLNGFHRSERRILDERMRQITTGHSTLIEIRSRPRIPDDGVLITLNALSIRHHLEPNHTRNRRTHNRTSGKRKN